MPIKSRIRTISDYPKPGIQFRDVTTLLQDPVGLRLSVEGLVKPFRAEKIDKVVAIEARGFMFGGAVALGLGAGFVPARKAGKLPHETISRDYEFEHGTDRIEIHTDAIEPGERILLIDDLIATGGTAEAAIHVIEQSEGQIVGIGVVIELLTLGGRERIEARGHELTALCAFNGSS